MTGPDYQLRKLKMPLFAGEDAYGWIYRVERFFDIQGLTTTGERLRAAVLCMEGQALAWYRWSQSREPFQHWEGLKGRLLERFQPSQEGDIYQQFLAMKQIGTASEYVGLFETLAAQLVGVPEKVLEGTFINGLKPEIRTAVCLLQPAGLNQAIKMTLLVDENRTGSVGEPSRSNSKLPPTRTAAGGVRQPAAVMPGGPRPAWEAPKQPFKCMTDAELADKRAKGLCFRCDGKFVLGHRCPERTLQVLVVHECEEAEEEEIADTLPEPHVHLDAVELSAQSAAGITGPHTMKLRATIHGIEVIVLIDSGATHNFVSLRVIERLQLPVSGEQETGVILGNGKAEVSYRMCWGVPLQLSGLLVVEDLIPLELGSTDVILGVKWLRKLGDTRVNWRKLTMTFQEGWGWVTLRGDPRLQ